eukprot:8362261-Ditylum_brightwellii.AAC.1
MKAKLEQQLEKILVGIGEELDRRNVGGQAYQAARILEEAKGVHQQMTDTLKEINNMHVNSQLAADQRTEE